MSESEIPVPVGWKVIVEPKRAKTTSAGGIIVEAGADAEEHLTYIGKLIAMGEAAYQTVTPGGIDMKQWKRVPEVGDWVIYSPYGGMRIRQSGRHGEFEDDSSRPKYLLMFNDTDIHGIIEDPDKFYSWVDA